MGAAVEADSLTKKMLKSLCCCYGWSYGVFWRFDQRNSMLLTLEDAYHEEEMGDVIDRMLLQVHMLGEGTIGRAAFTGKHQWISSENQDYDYHSFVSIRRGDMFQDEADLHYQFSIGIKIITVISVEQGVLQFGSTNKIPESPEFLSQAKNLFCHIENVDSSLSFAESFPSTPEMLSRDYNPLINHSLHSEDQFQMTSTDSQGLLSKANSHLQHTNSQVSTPCISTWSTEGSTLTSFEAQLPYARGFQNSLDAYSAKVDTLFSCGAVVQNFQDSLITSLQNTMPIEAEKDNLYSPGRLVNNQSLSPSICPTEGVNHEESASICTFQEQLSPAVCATAVPKPSLFDNIMQWLALSPEQGIHDQAALSIDDIAHSLGVSVDEGGGFDDIEAKVNPVQSTTDNTANSNGKENFSGVPHVDSYRLNVGSNPAVECWDEVKMPSATCHSATSTRTPNCISELDSTAGPRKGLFSELGLEKLLEDIVSNANYVTDSNSDDTSNAAKRRKTGSSLQTCNQADFSAPLFTGASFKPNQPLWGPDKLTNLGSLNEAVPKSQVGLWIDDSYSMNSSTIKQTKSHETYKKVTKKRAKPGESTRPRPKDRQLIQDRLKELKDIIPNSGKLSIDALLDRTIKHMLFLQSVTRYADRLTQDDEPKLIGQESGVVLRENFVGNSTSGGATWAFEVGDQTLVCPIIVEDLGPPGQMLIEMLCEEGGFFLEIADIIRGFSLTILKGVMEVRENKLWARFTVEANENITRMDVFMSLVHLLQQTTTTVKNSPNERSSVIDQGIGLFNNYQQPLESMPIHLTGTSR